MRIVPARTVVAALIALLGCAAGAGLARAQDLHVPTVAADTLAADSTSVPQRDVSDVIASILHKERKEAARPTRGLGKTLLPSIGYNPAYGAFLGASVALGGWLGEPEDTQLSSGSLGFSYSTSGQLSVQFKSDFFLPENKWALKGDWRYLNTSQDTWGLGPATQDQSAYPMDFVLYRMYQTVYRRVNQSAYYIGLGYHFDRYDEIRDVRAEEGELTPYSAYMLGQPSRTQTGGLSANVLADTRDNPINAHRGVYFNASLRFFMESLGSDAERQTMYSDFRAFFPVPARSPNTLAVWNTMWFTFGKAGYLDLPASGWDTYGRGARGYIQGRIRGDNQTYTEFEYRKRLTRDGLWGMVAFLNLTSTTRPSEGSFEAADFGGGLGLRVKFNKKTDTNLSIDGAYGQDRSVRFFFGLQEVY